MKLLWIFLSVCSVTGTLAGQGLPSDASRELTGWAFQMNWPVGMIGGATIATVKGHPFSATEENRTVQILANGTRIENGSVRKLYRDFDGRTRTESSDGMVTIADPVERFQAELDPKSKSVSRTNGRWFRFYKSNGQLFNLSFNWTSSETAVGTFLANLDRSAPSAGSSELKEDLGRQSVNGVSARGERVTVTIPKGQIGNDREIRVVTERWTSDDLQMLVKSTNSDPRYGETTYELKAVSLSSPDPTLFQIPPGYTERPGVGLKDVGGGGRGGRSPKQ
jgi:hypothetical protein